MLLQCQAVPGLYLQGSCVCLMLVFNVGGEVHLLSFCFSFSSTHGRYIPKIQAHAVAILVHAAGGALVNYAEVSEASEARSKETRCVCAYQPIPFPHETDVIKSGTKMVSPPLQEEGTGVVNGIRVRIAVIWTKILEVPAVKLVRPRTLIVHTYEIQNVGVSDRPPPSLPLPPLPDISSLPGDLDQNCQPAR